MKRRAGKARKQLDNEEIEDLFYGPGTSLINGAGYLGLLMQDRLFHELSDAEKKSVRVVMRADWMRLRSSLLRAWDERSDEELRIAAQYHGNPGKPWAEREFGDWQS